MFRPALFLTALLAPALRASGQSCALTNFNPPCPPPAAPWVNTWQLNRSTICQPGNTAGFLDAAAAARWGLVSLDWSIAYEVWNPPGGLANETTGASTLVEQCRCEPQPAVLACLCLALDAANAIFVKFGEY